MTSSESSHSGTTAVLHTMSSSKDAKLGADIKNMIGELNLKAFDGTNFGPAVDGEDDWSSDNEGQDDAGAGGGAAAGSSGGSSSGRGGGDDFEDLEADTDEEDDDEGDLRSGIQAVMNGGGGDDDDDDDEEEELEEDSEEEVEEDEEDSEEELEEGDDDAEEVEEDEDDEEVAATASAKGKGRKGNGKSPSDGDMRQLAGKFSGKFRGKLGQAQDGDFWYSGAAQLERPAAGDGGEGDGKLRGGASLYGRKLLAEELWKAEVAAFEGAKGSKRSADDRFMKMTLSSGTLTDKVAAMTLMVQESPMHRVKTMDILMAMAKKKGRRESQVAIEALKDLFQNSLLPGDRKLRSFGENALGHPDLGTDFKNTAVLVFWAFEAALKRRYVFGVGRRAIFEHGAVWAECMCVCACVPSRRR